MVLPPVTSGGNFDFYERMGPRNMNQRTPTKPSPRTRWPLLFHQRLLDRFWRFLHLGLAFAGDNDGARIG